MPLDKELLEVIVCPKCKGDLVYLVYEEEKERLICKACSVFYPVKEGIPILLIEEAKPLESENSNIT